MEGNSADGDEDGRRKVTTDSVGIGRRGSLCTGYGGLDLAVDAVLGGTQEWVSDIDPAVRVLLDAHYAGVPNLGDVRSVHWTTVAPVDVLTAGYPCQPFSEAGKGKGADDPRHLWPFVRDAIRHLRPGLVLLENVQGHLRQGFPQVLADLATLGFDAEWTVLRASDVGGCHRRARIFVAAYPANPDSSGQRAWSRLRRCDTPEDWWRLSRDRRRQAAPDPTGQQREDESPCGNSPPLPLGAILGTGSGADVGHLASGTVVDRRGARIMAWGVYEPAIRQHEQLIGRPAPWPQDDRGLLSAAFVEWMMAVPEGRVIDHLGRSSAIRVLGNGVFLPAGVAAVDHLLDRLEAAAVAA